MPPGVRSCCTADLVPSCSSTLLVFKLRVHKLHLFELHVFKLQALKLHAFELNVFKSKFRMF